MFAERSQVVIIERKLHSRCDRYGLMIPIRALQHDLTPLLRPWRYTSNTFPKFNYKRWSYKTHQARGAQQDCSLFGTADKRKKFPLTIKFQPDKTNLAQIQQQFRQQENLSQARIKPDKVRS